MVKKIFFLLFLCITMVSLWAEDAEHNRIGIEKRQDFKMEMELSNRMKFQFISGYNIYDFLPQVGFNFIIFDDYLFSINQSISVRMKESAPMFKEKKFAIKAAFNDTVLGFTWQPSYQRWRFKLGLVSTLPTVPWVPKNADSFVTGSGRFGEEVFFAVNYITDPVVIGGRVSYTFVSPVIKNKESGWIPCILTSAVNVTAVLNHHISLSCIAAISWDSGPLQSSHYISGQSSLMESVKFNASWTENKWSISGELEFLHSSGVVLPIWGLSFTRELYGK
ncbi:hypothetical protein [Treponema phagedenis]|uniref:hypothetical protein n=1 Tax=Treponema phagedenis TaxID=162 RepID=UPI00197F116E|nr:hypothetical protein [Treponema phagedenis]QSH95221.1 hypothetical protein C5O78_09305 [Treponema phagedenis]